MRKLAASVVVGMAFLAAFMVFVAPSLAAEPASNLLPADTPLAEAEKKPAVPFAETSVPTPTQVSMISIRGTISEAPTETVTGTWTVTDEAGATWIVTVTEETKIVPPVVDPAPGDTVQVLGSQDEASSHSLLGWKIVVKKENQQRARPVAFHGEIEKLPVSTDTVDGSEGYHGEWVIAGFTVTVDAETMIHPDKRTPEVGMRANVIAFKQSDGALWAHNIALHKPEEAENEVEIEGLIEELPDPPYLGTWVVDGFTVTVTNTTDLKGATPALSLTAKVKGQELEDGSILADKVIVEGPEHEEMEFEGAILVFTDTRPSQWVIEKETPTGPEPVTVTVTADTYVNTNKGPIQVGTWVEVKAFRQTDGTLEAVLIKVEDDVEEDIRVEFEGTVVVTGTIPGDWVIQTDSKRITIAVTSDTKVVPPWASLTLGSEVEVKALQRPDGTLHARLIKVERPAVAKMEIEGTIVATDTIPGHWVIQTGSERITVEVTTKTLIVPPWASLTLGDEVKVLAVEQTGGSLRAFLIRIERVELERIEIEGTVVATDTIPGEWVIRTDSERITVEVATDTVVLPRGASLSLGDEVKVEAVEGSDGALLAVRIKIESPDPEPEEMTLEGTLVTTGTVPGDWVIETDAGRVTVTVTSDTSFVLHGISLTVGVEVRVEVVREPGGTLRVVELEIDIDSPDFEAMEFSGTVVTTDTIPGDWVIETATERITVHVTSYTVVLPRGAALSHGAQVNVQAVRKPNGKIQALLIRIEAEEPDAEGAMGLDPAVPEPDVIETKPGKAWSSPRSVSQTRSASSRRVRYWSTLADPFTTGSVARVFRRLRVLWR